MSASSIAHFPGFSKLELYHKDALLRFGATFGHYSDFNFTSLFCWNIDDSAAISLLNGNLVMRLPDYGTCEPCYSLLGVNRVDESLAALFDMTHVLKLVPGVVVEGIKCPDEFCITEDVGSHDYIFCVRDHVELQGKKYKKLRNKLHRFERDTAEHSPVSVSVHSTVKASRLPRYGDLLQEWTLENGGFREAFEREMTAILRLLGQSHALTNLVIIEFIQNGRLVAFSISELLGNDWAICHFQKALRVHKYFSTFITVQEAEILQGLGCTWVNWEQDLGICGLRASKSVYAPAEMLRKYRISQKGEPVARSTSLGLPAGARGAGRAK